jgi:carboxypeptidase PM20D1
MTVDPILRLAQALRFATISHEDPALVDQTPFFQIHQYLEESFPQVHRLLARELIEESSLLFTWRGKDSSLAPVLFAGHIDVVPVESGTEAEWRYPPFEGCIEEGFIWGRGALDDKVAVLGLLEAAEALLAQGFQPQRTIYLAFGHDEEVGGTHGAQRIAAVLQQRGVRLEFALDEGLAVTEGIVPKVNRPVAMVGIAEKGYLCLELSVESSGGHSSMPPSGTAIGILSAAITRLERHPMPPRRDSLAFKMLQRLAPEMPFPLRTLLAHPRLFGGIVQRQLATSSTMNAILRTTTAPTILQAGVKENVLPTRARAVINFRLLPGDSIASVTQHVQDVIDDPRVQIRPVGSTRSEPSPVASVDTPNFERLEKAILAAFPKAIVVPGLVLGATDCRHYAPLSQNAYRFTPIWVRQEDLSRVHGTNERLSIDNYLQAIAFYQELMAGL